MKKFVLTCITAIFILLCVVFSFKPVFKSINYGIDLQGGFEVIYKIEPLIKGGKLTEKDFDNTYKAIVNRIDTLGVSEPVINFEGKNILRIQLPGVSNENEARERISTTAVLTFRDTNDNILMTADILGSGKASLDQGQQTLKPVVKLDIANSDKFYEVTKEASQKGSDNNRIVIWLDFEEGKNSFALEKDTCGKDGNMKCISAPAVNEAIRSNDVIIEGDFTKKEAQNLVDLINSGSLPTKLTEESTPRSVSASFGNDTIKKAAIAGIITQLIITLIMTLKYRVSGFISSMCLIVYSLLVFLIFNAIDGVLTITGIAALVLGIGMAVDSSVLSIERIKDEIKSGKSLKESTKDGNKRSIVAIIDANISALLVGVVLYMYGESAVKGFALMFIITILTTMIVMVALNRFALNSFIKTGFFDKRIKAFLGNENKTFKFDFIKHAPKQIIFSGLIILIGLILSFTGNINFGIDFSGGTNIRLSSKENIDFSKVIKELDDYNIVDYDNYLNDKKEGYIRIENILNNKQENDVKDKLTKLNLDSSINEISTRVTKNLTKNAILSLSIAFIAIIIYMTMRFNFNYAVSGILALLHDILITIAVFVIFKLEFNFIVVAALLTIIGYSINDTIVIFDRIREIRAINKKNNKNKKSEDLKEIVNYSVNETLTRNIQTSTSTVISVIVLLFLGISEIYTFNIAILIGLIGGSLSTFFMAPKIWLILEKRSIKKPKKEVHELEELNVWGINK
jgi:SecD/SecF fusion protein